MFLPWIPRIVRWVRKWMSRRKYDGFRVCAIGNAIRWVSAERNQVSRDRGFSGKQFTSLWCTQPFQSFTLAGESDKRIGKQTFRQYRSAARSSPLFLPMEPAQLLSHVISPRRSWNDPAVSTILLITSGFFNWIWSTAIPLSHPSDRKPTICTDLCRLPSPPPPFIYWLHLWKILKRVSRKRIDPVSLGCLSLGLMFLRYIRFNVIWFFLVIRFKVFIYLYFFFS